MSGWVIGWAIGGAVVVVVVLLLFVMIRLSSRAGDKAEEILAALEAARDNTAALWTLTTTNEAAARIVDGAADARQALSGREEA
jgi:hypothetical protein